MKRFTIGFLFALLGFGVANFVSYYVRSDELGAADAIRRVGFPFLVWEAGGFAYRSHFSFAGLCGNIAIAFCLSALAGLTLRELESGTTPRAVRAIAGLLAFLVFFGLITLIGVIIGVGIWSGYANKEVGVVPGRPALAVLVLAAFCSVGALVGAYSARATLRRYDRDHPVQVA